MGTNYYYVEHDICPTCGHNSGRKMHIGKSSGGWTFALRVYPDQGINSLNDWVSILKNRGGEIYGEYGRVITYDAMMDIITNREGRYFWDIHPHLDLYGYRSEEEFHRMNNSERGPNGLVRSKVDGSHCVGHGNGTWDYVIGEFS